MGAQQTRKQMETQREDQPGYWGFRLQEDCIRELNQSPLML